MGLADDQQQIGDQIVRAVQVANDVVYWRRAQALLRGRGYVEQEVEARIKRYDDEQNQKSKDLIAVLGVFPYGMANTPREEQISKGIAYYMEART